MRIFIVILLIAAGAALFWWRYSLPPEVEVARPRRGPAVDAVYATGTVEPVHWAQIASTETGRIVDYPAEEGARVTEGQVLLRLDDRKARGVVAELESHIAFLEADAKRYETLVQRETVSRQAYDRVKTELDRNKALTMVARQKLEDLTIRAPMDGIVIRKDGEIGEVVRADEVLLWIGTEPPYWITANVDEEDIPQVRPGKVALIKADAYPTRSMEGIVAEITPKGDPVQKQYRVRILLPADSPLMIGMTTEINIVVREDTEALLIPERALAGNLVWVVEGDQVRERRVEVGVYGDRLVEIRGGLSEDDRVVLDPPKDFVDGQVVRLAEEGA